MSPNKSLSYWPQRFVTDLDADATLRLFGEVADSGRTLALMDPAATWPTDLEPVFADRFPYEPSCYETLPAALPGLWPDEPGELMVPAI